MSTVLTSRFRSFALLGATVSLLLAGCGSGPHQAGSAAIIGDTAIPLEQVQQQLDMVLRKEPEAEKMRQQRKLDQVARQIVTLAVQNQLLKVAAQREGIVIDEKLVTRTLDDAGGAELASQQTVHDAGSIRDRVRDQLLQVELGRKYVDKLQVTVDYFFTKDSREAIAKAKEVAANPNRMTEFVRDAAKSADGRALAELGKTVSSAEMLDFAPTLLFGAKPGTVIAFSPNPANAQWMVALVHDRRTDARSSSESAEQRDPSVLGGIGLRVTQSLAEELNIRINPRYGVWDPAAMAVAPSEQEKAGFQAVVRKTSP